MIYYQGSCYSLGYSKAQERKFLHSTKKRQHSFAYYAKECFTVLCKRMLPLFRAVVKFCSPTDYLRNKIPQNCLEYYLPSQHKPCLLPFSYTPCYLICSWGAPLILAYIKRYQLALVLVSFRLQSYSFSLDTRCPLLPITNDCHLVLYFPIRCDWEANASVFMTCNSRPNFNRIYFVLVLLAKIRYIY